MKRYHYNQEKIYAQTAFYFLQYNQMFINFFFRPAYFFELFKYQNFSLSTVARDEKYLKFSPIRTIIWIFWIVFDVLIENFGCKC